MLACINFVKMMFTYSCKETLSVSALFNFEIVKIRTANKRGFLIELLCQMNIFKEIVLRGSPSVTFILVI